LTFKFDSKTLTIKLKKETPVLEKKPWNCWRQDKDLE